MDIHEWCIAVLKGKKRNLRFAELYDLCCRHYLEHVFNTEEELLKALEPFSDFFLFEEFNYDYVTFLDDGLKDSPTLELAKDVLRSHGNRYTLSVLARRMGERQETDGVTDEYTLKELLCSRDCFTIERRAITFFKLSAMGEACDISPISLGRAPKTEEQIQEEKEAKLAREQEKLLRKKILEQERERKRRLKMRNAERREEQRIEKMKALIAYYKVTDGTSLEQLSVEKLIRKIDQTKCAAQGLLTVGDVFRWVEDNHLTENGDKYRKITVERMLKIASFHSPELVALIPKVKFNGMQKAFRAIRQSQQEQQA